MFNSLASGWGMEDSSRHIGCACPCSPGLPARLFAQATVSVCRFLASPYECPSFTEYEPVASITPYVSLQGHTDLL